MEWIKYGFALSLKGTEIALFSKMNEFFGDEDRNNAVKEKSSNKDYTK